MNINDLITYIGDEYTGIDDRLERNYKREFTDTYSSSKLEKIWECIQENHTHSKPPELGQIFKYMALMGIARSKDNGIFYNRCTQQVQELDYGKKPLFDDQGNPVMKDCNTKYSLRSKFCPTCNYNRLLGSEEGHISNTKEVVKCNKLPRDIFVVNELCSVCSVYHKDPTARGSKCSAWGSHDEYKKSSKNCKDCKCFTCCNDKPMNSYQRAIIDQLAKSKKV